MQTALAPPPSTVDAAAPAAPAAPAPAAAPVARSFPAWLRPLGAVGILAFLVWRLGAGPFLDGLRGVDARAVAAALGIGVLTTVCCAWRWSLVAGGVGLRLPLAAAVAACYRSVFLNATLPGGVLGDVHRAVRHGRDAGDVNRGIRAVVWERTAGQVVQLGMAIVVLSAFPSPVRRYVPAFAVAAGLGVAVVSVALRRAGRSRWAGALRNVRAEIRDGVLTRHNAPRIAFASAVVVCGHLATFLVAARAAGSAAPLSRLVPLTLLALLAMGLPANVAGFGPREGVAAWAFAAAGLSATQGVAAAVSYGALVLFSSLPGAVVLVLERIRVPAADQPEGVAHA